jgi:hypothetical protein
MMRKTVLRTLAAIVLVSVMLVAVPAYAAPGAPRIPGLRLSTSTNWSGYAVETNLVSPQINAVTDVKGSWTVTAVTKTSVNAYSASWIGIDGYSSGTVEQIGTEADWVNGQAVYSAWYEMYPKWSKTISTLTIKPGDVMTAEVKYTSQKAFVLTLKDTTTGKSFTTTQKSGSAKRSSAEWIVEAPWSGGTLPLANFGVIPFTGAAATINGHGGAIDDPLWQYDPLTMVGSSGNTLATPSLLSLYGSAFSMTWQDCN